MIYDPAPPYGADIERDRDYKKCNVCGTWCCALGAHKEPVYVCRMCRTAKDSK